MPRTKKRFKTEAERNLWEIARAKRWREEDRLEREAEEARAKAVLKTCWWANQSLLED
jgi:hypothetical protein